MWKTILNLQTFAFLHLFLAHAPRFAVPTRCACASKFKYLQSKNPKTLHSPSPVLKGSSIQKTSLFLCLSHTSFSLPRALFLPSLPSGGKGGGREAQTLSASQKEKKGKLVGGGEGTFQTKAFFPSSHFPTNSNSSGSRNAKGWLNAKGEQRARRALHDLRY